MGSDEVRAVQRSSAALQPELKRSEPRVGAWTRARQYGGSAERGSDSSASLQIERAVRIITRPRKTPRPVEEPQTNANSACVCATNCDPGGRISFARQGTPAHTLGNDVCATRGADQPHCHLPETSHRSVRLLAQRLCTSQQASAESARRTATRSMASRTPTSCHPLRPPMCEWEFRPICCPEHSRTAS